MTIKTTTQQNNLASAYASNGPAGSVYTTTPTSSPGTEPSGGSPAYARKTIGWGSPSGGVITGSATFDIPSGTTLVGAGVHSSTSGTAAATYLDGTTVTSQAFASQGTYAVTFTFTET